MNAPGPAGLPIHRRKVIGGMIGGMATVAAWAVPWRESASSKYVTPEAFGAKGDGVANDAEAFRKACRHCAATGNHLRLSARRYRGARIEVHGSFDVMGEGATVDYVGIGNTLIGGRGQGRGAVASAWPAVDRDAYADQFPVRMLVLARETRQGATELLLPGAVALKAGDQLFLAQRPTSMSSPINYVPSSFCFAKVRSVAGDRVTLVEPLQQPFQAGAGVFTSTGTAVGCRISDLTIATDADAYQHVVRSGVDVIFERITFAGKSAVGACTFAEGVTYRDCHAVGAYGPLSTARGCDRVLIDGFTFETRRNPPTAQPFAIFIEESLRDIEVRRVVSEGAGFSIRMTDMAPADTRGRVRIDGCRFRSDNAVEGATAPFQGGVAIGLDIDVANTVFRGAAIRPDSNQFPGIGQRALTWLASNGGQDRLSFAGCTFESVDGGVAIATGSGFQGQLAMDPRRNRYIGCQPPS